MMHPIGSLGKEWDSLLFLSFFSFFLSSDLHCLMSSRSKCNAPTINYFLHGLFVCGFLFSFVCLIVCGFLVRHFDLIFFFFFTRPDSLRLHRLFTRTRAQPCFSARKISAHLLCGLNLLIFPPGWRRQN